MAPAIITASPFSTKFFASTSPSVWSSSRTALIAAIFCSPAEINTTSYADFSSATATSGATVPAPDIITGAAAETPNFSSIAFTSSESSNTVIFSIDSMTFLASADSSTEDFDTSAVSSVFVLSSAIT